MIHCIPGDQISHIQIMVAKSGLTNRANVHIPIGVKKSLWFNAQHGRIPIDPAILAAIGHRFIAKKNPKFKMLVHRSDATRADTRNRILFFKA